MSSPAHHRHDPHPPHAGPKPAHGHAHAAEHEALEHKALPHAEIRTIVIGIMLAMFLGALDQTIVATALPTIGRHFGDLGDLSWVVTAYLLTGTASIPLYGKLSDIHGRRGVMLVAIALFTWVRTPSSTVGSRTSKPMSGFISFCVRCIITSTGTRFL